MCVGRRGGGACVRARVRVCCILICAYNYLYILKQSEYTHAGSVRVCVFVCVCDCSVLHLLQVHLSVLLRKTGCNFRNKGVCHTQKISRNDFEEELFSVITVLKNTPVRRK